MSRSARKIKPLSEEILEAAADDFMRCALAALEGQIPNQRELAERLGWPRSTLGSVLKAGFSFKTWPMICRALGRDPIDELVRGQQELRRMEDRERERSYRRMLERAQADTMVAFWKCLPARERSRILEVLSKSR